MREYHKIQTMFKRDLQKNKIIYDDWTLPEFEYLKNNTWEFTEKVDGTNIRIMFDGVKIKYGGKTDNAQIPMDLINRLDVLFSGREDMFKVLFENSVDVCLYGEGYGAGIQKGGKYGDSKDFVLFDVKIGDWWLERNNVDDIANKLSIKSVPVIGEGTLYDAINIVKGGRQSQWGRFVAEGIVARPKVELKQRSGRRIITKIKYVDFSEVK